MGVPTDDPARLPLEHYDLIPPCTWFPLAHAGKNNRTLGLQTGDGAFVARTYTSPSYADPAAIDYEQRLLAWLDRQGLSFAVPLPIPVRDGALRCQGPGGWAALVPMSPGTPLALQPHDGELLGTAIGELQATLQHYPPKPRPGRPLFNAPFDFPRPARDPLTLTPAHLGLPDTQEHDALLGWWREEAAQLHAFANGPYRELPQLMCHNDITPNNVLAVDGCVTAVLDFEFATPAARALEFVAGLRMVLRHWEPGDPLATLPPFCRGYARWLPLTAAEVAALPHLLRLRGAITVLWWLGYTAPGDTAPILSSIGNLQRLVRWLDKENARLVDTTSRALLR